MFLQYQIANHLIDISRNEIIRDKLSANELIHKLPPKTILVLTELAKYQGQVLSHDQLMNAVWENTYVSANSLQRCIGQLRKALADDSKQQRVIKTHAKQGYSLELTVVFIQRSEEALTPRHFENEPSTELSNTELASTQSATDESVSANNGAVLTPERKKAQKRVNRSVLSVAIIAVFIGIISYLFPPDRDFNFNTLTPVTTSDNQERSASYSPDEKFILYHRYDGLCNNKIWAKELATGNESKLTTTYGFYSDHSFNKEGDTLAFMAKVECSAVKKQQSCWNLMTLDFEQALKSPQKPQLKASCEQGILAQPTWLNNGNIAALNKQNDRWQIVKFMPDAPSFVGLYTPQNKNYYHLVYARKIDKLIAIAINLDNEHVIDIISLEGELISSHPIVRPQSLSPYQMIEPTLDTQQAQLLFSTGKRLFSLSYDGRVEQVSTLNHHNLANFKMSNNGENIVTVQGVVDTDIASVNLETLKQNEKTDSNTAQGLNFNQVHQPYPSIARSIAEDYDAQFQPKGDLIAFISTRSGTSQIWLQHKDKLTQLTNFPIDTLISNFNWNPSGDSIVLTANAQLMTVKLDKTLEVMPLNFAALKIYQWHDNDDILMSISQTGTPHLVKYNVGSHKITTLLKGEIKWASQVGQNQLLYLDIENILWIKTGDNVEQVKALKDQIGSHRFIVKNNKVYGINNKKQLWSFSPGDNQVTILGRVDMYTAFISDIKASQLLLTQTIAAKKDVVILSNTNL